MIKIKIILVANLKTLKLYLYLANFLYTYYLLAFILLFLLKNFVFTFDRLNKNSFDLLFRSPILFTGNLISRHPPPPQHPVKAFIQVIKKFKNLIFPLIFNNAATPFFHLEVVVRDKIDGAVVLRGRDLGVNESPPAAQLVSSLNRLQWRGVARIGFKPDRANGLSSI